MFNSINSQIHQANIEDLQVVKAEMLGILNKYTAYTYDRARQNVKSLILAKYPKNTLLLAKLKNNKMYSFLDKYR